MGNAQTIVSVAAGRHLPVYAAVVAVDHRLHRIGACTTPAAQTDHDSEGLFQQRISIYRSRVADDPVKATNAFLDRLVRGLELADRPVGT